MLELLVCQLQQRDHRDLLAINLEPERAQGQGPKPRAQGPDPGPKALGLAGMPGQAGWAWQVQPNSWRSRALAEVGSQSTVGYFMSSGREGSEQLML